MRRDIILAVTAEGVDIIAAVKRDVEGQARERADRADHVGVESENEIAVVIESERAFDGGAVEGDSGERGAVDRARQAAEGDDVSIGVARKRNVEPVGGDRQGGAALRDVEGGIDGNDGVGERDKLKTVGSVAVDVGQDESGIVDGDGVVRAEPGACDVEIGGRSVEAVAERDRTGDDGNVIGLAVVIGVCEGGACEREGGGGIAVDEAAADGRPRGDLEPVGGVAVDLCKGVVDVVDVELVAGGEVGAVDVEVGDVEARTETDVVGGDRNIIGSIIAIGIGEGGACQRVSGIAVVVEEAVADARPR